MGLRDMFGRRSKRFWREEAFQRESANQLSMAPGTLGRLAQLGVTSDDQLKLEYFLYTGWTPRLTMSADVVQAWVRQMCDLGFKHDCQFDGWGTTPEQ